MKVASEGRGDCRICSCIGQTACFTLEDQAECTADCKAVHCLSGDVHTSTDCFVEPQCDVVNPAQSLLVPSEPAPLFGPLAAALAVIAALAGSGWQLARRRAKLR